MDPITTAIAAAASAGLAAGATDVSKKAIVDAYNSITAYIKKRFGDKSELADAVKKLEAKPDSESRKGMLAEEVKSVKADSDAALIKLVEKLIEALKQTPEGSKVIGKYQIEAKNSNIGIIGDNAKVVGGINLGNKP